MREMHLREPGFTYLTVLADRLLKAKKEYKHLEK